jgi:hypothetical protein
MSVVQNEIDIFINKASQKIVDLSDSIGMTTYYDDQYEKELQLAVLLIDAIEVLVEPNDLSTPDKIYITRKLSGIACLYGYDLAQFSNRQVVFIPGNGNGGGGGGLVPPHNELTGLDAGDPANEYFGHLTEDEVQWIKDQMFTGPTVNFPAPAFGGTNDGAEKNTTFNYNVTITVVPNKGIIESIRVFKTTGGVENSIPIINTVSLSFALNDSVTDNASYRLELRYRNNNNQILTINTVRTINFYYPTYYGPGPLSMNQAQVITAFNSNIFTKAIWSSKDRLLLTYTLNNTAPHFIEPKSNDSNGRRITEVANNYTDDFLKPDEVWDFSGTNVTMTHYVLKNLVLASSFDFNFFLV